jgi:hypothetical protein
MESILQKPKGLVYIRESGTGRFTRDEMGWMGLVLLFAHKRLLCNIYLYNKGIPIPEKRLCP